KDPFALRRSAIGSIELIQRHGLRFSLRHTLEQAFWGWINVLTARMCNDPSFDAYIGSQRKLGWDDLKIHQALLADKGSIPQEHYLDALQARLRVTESTRALLSTSANFLMGAPDAL